MSDLNPNFEEKQTVSEEKTEKPTPDSQENIDTEPKIQDSCDDCSEQEEASKDTMTLQKKKTVFAAEVLDYLEVIVVAICVVILLFSFAFRLCRVKGESMENTLFDGEALIVSDLFYTPERGDIVVFHQTGKLNEPVVKRIIATEGETVHIQHSYQTMIITVTDENGKETVLKEDYMKYDGIPLYLNDMIVTVPKGQLFVLGDNRNNSKDSRHADIGLVDERRVLGKVMFRVTPFSRFGTVD